MTKLAQILDAAFALAAGLAPGALGAAVSLAYEKGLTWTDMFVQFAVGTCVSWFAGRAIGAIWAVDPFVLQGVSFTAGMIAFKAAPRFASNASDFVADLPRLLRDRFLPSAPKDDR